MSMSETIEWHRADELLPDAETDVLVIIGGYVDMFIGFQDGTGWYTSEDGYPLEEVLFWADMPKGPAQ